MATTIESKPCQANANGMTCEKDARAKCFHCSRDLCLMHLTEHAQLIENQTQTFLYSHETILNNFHSKVGSLSVSPRISESPFIQLEKWRLEAHQRIDQLAEQKHQDIQHKLSEYQTLFAEKINEQKQKIEVLKKRFIHLSRQTHVTNKDIQYLEERIDQIRQFFKSIEKHSIQVSTDVFSVHIRTHFFDLQSSEKSTPSTSPIVMQSPHSTRKARPEVKLSVSNRNKQRSDKKRSLSFSLL